MNRILRSFLLTALAVPLLTLAPGAPVCAAERRLSTNKTVYEEGEDILVTAVGEGKDWVGIYARGETPGTPASIYWYYVAEDAEPGEAVNIKKTRSNNRAEYASLPGGAYTVFLLLNDGYTVAESADITVLPAPERRLSVGSGEIYEGAAVPVTAYGKGGETVVLCRPGDPASAEPLASFTVTEENTSRETALTLPDGALPVGGYELRLLPAGGGDPVVSVGFRVSEAKVPDAPAALDYRADRLAEGLAGGTATLTPAGDGAAAEDFFLWWGKGGKPLAGFTFLARAHGSAGPVTFTLPANLTVPEGAEEILACASNRFGTSEYASAALPEETRAFDALTAGEPLLRFQVTSDWHVTDDPRHDHNRHAALMLDDIASVCPDSAALVGVGDIADHGSESEYRRVSAILAEHPDAPPVHFVIGNHDVSFGAGYGKQIEIFNRFSGNDNPYYDLWIGGYHFLFLAGESAGAPVPIPPKEMKWLEGALAEDASPEKPIFVFCHESIRDTVAGSTAEEGWWGVSNGDELAALFSRYPQVIFFNGHSHWELSSENEMFAGDEKRTFTAFNTSAVGYLWTGYNVVPGEYLYGSEGLFVEVRENAVTVRGRDFVNGLWTASAQYAVPGAWTTAAAPEPNAAEPDAAPPDPDVPEAEPEPEPGPEPDAPESGGAQAGCASALNAAAVLPAVCAGALVLRRRKPSDTRNRKAFL